MYETEVNGLVESPLQIPPDVLAHFAELAGSITGRSVLPWSEHCTECVWPTCYSTCDLYRPREDGRCRRFVDGMVRIESSDGVNPYLLKIKFKRWGKLWAVGNTHLVPVKEARRLEHRDMLVGSALRTIPLATLRRSLVSKRYNNKKLHAASLAGGTDVPSHFACECYNPQSAAIRLSLTIRPMSEGHHLAYQTVISAAPGFTRAKIPVTEISRNINLLEPFTVEIIPNDVADGTTLYFGLMDFVREQAVAAPQAKPCKCVVWDLDHTVWDGVLIEDGASSLRPKPRIVEVLKELDARGILLSVASKNQPADALEVLKRLDIDDLFLCPQISWEPKSESIRRIARALNIGLDSILFVDDSPFERAQVEAACPGVRTLDALEYLGVPDRADCLVTPTAESRKRRQLYREQVQRETLRDASGSDYLGFLRDCNITLTIRPFSEPDMDRVHELAQRTNQLNFSGSRYDRAVLARILGDRHLDGYVLECEDRFGSYGTIGFSIVDSRVPIVTDLMFSCRVQSKRVEHAFLMFVLRRYRERHPGDLHVRYRRTSRNAPAGQVFDDLGFVLASEADGVQTLVFGRDIPVPDEDVIRVTLTPLPEFAGLGSAAT